MDANFQGLCLLILQFSSLYGCWMYHFGLEMIMLHSTALYSHDTRCYQLHCTGIKFEQQNALLFSPKTMVQLQVAISQYNIKKEITFQLTLTLSSRVLHQRDPPVLCDITKTHSRSAQNMSGQVQSTNFFILTSPKQVCSPKP